MIIDLITSEISSHISDIIAVSGLFLLALISIRSLKLMQVGAEFDRLYKNELASNPNRFKYMTAEKHDKWRNEYVHARLNPRSYSNKKKTKLLFNKTSLVSSEKYNTNKIISNSMPYRFNLEQGYVLRSAPVSVGTMDNIRASREAMAFKRSGGAVPGIQKESFKSGLKVVSKERRKSAGQGDKFFDRSSKISLDRTSNQRREDFNKGVVLRAKYRGFHTKFDLRRPDLSRMRFKA